MGLLIGLLTLSVADRIWQLIDFAGNNDWSERQFLIGRAYVSHGKGVSYHIQLNEYFADLILNREDYTRAFGSAEEVRPIDYCLKARVEQHGAALRIMYSSVRAIPAGQITRCVSNIISIGNAR